MSVKDTPKRETKEYRQFKTLPRNKIVVNNRPWVYYDVSPKSKDVGAPLVLIHGTCGTAESFFYQLVALSAKGYRVLSVQFPSYWDVSSWVKGFKGFLSSLGLNKIHLFGNSLGGFLAVHFLAAHPAMVASLVLCNAFVDTLPFHQNAGCLKMFRFLPEFYLKKYVLESLPQQTHDPATIDFVVEQLELLGGDDLGSRLTLNCLKSELRALPPEFNQKTVTLLDSNDDVVLPQEMRDRLYATFPHARLGLLKTGGDFPFLSVPDEVNMHLQVHLRVNGLYPAPPTSEEKSVVDAYDSVFVTGGSSSNSAHVARPAVNTTTFTKPDFGGAAASAVLAAAARTEKPVPLETETTETSAVTVAGEDAFRSPLPLPSDKGADHDTADSGWSPRPLTQEEQVFVADKAGQLLQSNSRTGHPPSAASAADATTDAESTNVVSVSEANAPAELAEDPFDVNPFDET